PSTAGAVEMAQATAAAASWQGTKDREQTALSASPNWPADCSTSGQSKPALSDAETVHNCRYELLLGHDRAEERLVYRAARAVRLAGESVGVPRALVRWRASQRACRRPSADHRTGGPGHPAQE